MTYSPAVIATIRVKESELTRSLKNSLFWKAYISKSPTSQAIPKMNMTTNDVSVVYFFICLGANSTFNKSVNVTLSATTMHKNA
jgi:hypothetical protein